MSKDSHIKIKVGYVLAAIAVCFIVGYGIGKLIALL